LGSCQLAKLVEKYYPYFTLKILAMWLLYRDEPRYLTESLNLMFDSSILTVGLLLKFTLFLLFLAFYFDVLLVYRFGPFLASEQGWLQSFARSWSLADLHHSIIWSTNIWLPASISLRELPLTNIIRLSYATNLSLYL